MEIKLYCGEWFINGYRISGNEENGYTVYLDTDDSDNHESYSNPSFEKCLTWVYNS